VNISSKVEVSKFRYDPALDGWRAISIALVVISHAGLGNIIPGGFGVTIFFFISGYLITSLLLIEWNRSGGVSLVGFYLRRFWRLAPPLIVYILISVLLIFFIKHTFPFKEMFAALFYFANYYHLLWRFDPLGVSPSPLQILWSLAIEEHYYLFFAPIFIFAIRRSRVLILFILLLCFAPLIWRCSLISFNTIDWLNNGYIYMATETRIDSIAWGALLAWLKFTHGEARVAKIFDNTFIVLGSIGILIFCLVYRDVAFRESFRYTLQGITLMSIIFTSLYGRCSSFSRHILETKYFVWLGKLSYSLYLYHWLSKVLAGLFFEVEFGLGWQVVFWPLSFLLASASYYYLEHPMLRIRKRFGSKAE
jgi:peptidoglycan/LPS O-acetylase OafA/YrhL